MTWVITRLCRDCISEYVGPASDQFPNQLYIDPEECIDCQACEPVCPWGRHCATPRCPQCSRTTSL
jgi:uncharacterized Fe-S center protein